MARPATALPRGAFGADRRLAFSRSAACSAAHWAAVGERLSSAQDSRCRSSGTWASQHETLQKARPVRLRLQVETLQVQYFAPSAMGFLQALHRRHCPSSATVYPPLAEE